MARVRGQAGFSLVELMAVVTVVAVLAAVAIPRLGGSGIRSRASSDFTRKVSLALEQARTRAMAERRNFRVTLTSSSLTTDSLLASGTWQNETTIAAPAETRIWSVVYAAAIPTVVMTASHTVTFKPDFTIEVDGPTNLNAFIYIGPTLTTALGARWLITLIATGSQQVVDMWR